MHNSNLAIDSTVFHSVLKVTLGVLAIFASAQITLPVQPVPVTLGTFIIMVIGLTYSRKEAVATTLSYLALGAVGLPMFTNMQGGFAKIMGPSGGYLLGYLLAAAAMTYLKEKLNLSNLYNCLIGQTLLYIPGVLWLSTFIGLEASLYKGLLVYIPSGIVKIIILLSVLRAIKKS